jgi:hypothetical protein
MNRLLLILASTAGIVTAAELQTVQPIDFTVHEWGTFTSVAGEDGSAIDWDALGGVNDLPRFVNDFGYRCFKWRITGTVRMETPVLYFYSPQALEARVKVSFPQGLITEWYPQAQYEVFQKSKSDGATHRMDNKEPWGIDTSLRSVTGAIEWPSIHVEPNTFPALPTETAPSRYYAARGTDSAPVTVGEEHEKFLFRDGNGQSRRSQSSRRQALGRANPTLARALQHRHGSDPARDDRRLRHPEKSRRQCQPRRPAALTTSRHKLIVQVCDEILAGQHHDMFPLHVWMTGSGTQFNMNVNEVISNRCCQLAGTPLGSKTPVHPNDHVNMSQSSNDSFPSAMYIAAAVNVKQRLIPAVKALHDAIAAKAEEWKDIVKIGRTHMQDATPLTLGQEWSGYAGMLADDLDRIEDALKGVYQLALGGTAVGTGINAAPGFAEAAAAEIARSRVCRSSAPRTSSPCRARTTRWCSFPARCARWPCRSTRSATTSG